MINIQFDNVSFVEYYDADKVMLMRAHAPSPCVCTAACMPSADMTARNATQDPWQMENLHKSAEKATLAKLHAKVQAWYHCAGDACP